MELTHGFFVGGESLNVEKRFCSVGVVVVLAGARARSSRPREEAGPQLAERPPSHVACIVLAFSASFAVVGAPPFLYTLDVSECGRSREWRQGMPVRYEDFTAARVTG